MSIRNVFVVLSMAHLMLAGAVVVLAQDDGAAKAKVDALVKASY